MANVIGAKTRRDGSYEGGGYVVSWCVGHLLGLAEPQVYDEKYAKWRYEDLPIMPQKWQYTPNDSTKKQLKTLCDLMKRSDIDCIINACDAGREGELIFRLVYEHSGCKKPIKRLWISSMEEAAITNGFCALKDGAEYESLYHAALCRQQADWLVGMNFSRGFSVLYNAQLRVGRVQTPTLAMIVEREGKISSFVKEAFYIVEIADGGLIAGREKLKDKQTAENISAECMGKTATVTSVQRSEKSTAPPKLYDLTTLQREANRTFGYTAAQTLSCVQNMYEQKLCTYPRTDSRFLTEDMAAGIPSLIQSVSPIFDINIGNINVAAVINNAKVSDHHAIIPTPSMPKASLSALPTAERNILTMICARLITATGEKHLYAETAITVECGGEVFTTKGKTVTQEGWTSVTLDPMSRTARGCKNSELPELTEGYSFTAKTSVREGFTQPQKHYTEDLLLAAMETAGASDIPEDAERRGLGTPATRANIIETLVKSGMLERNNKLLLPTTKGVNLIKVLPESVKSPLLTAEWENQLSCIERGELTAADFMTVICNYVEEIIKTYQNPTAENRALFPSDKKTGVIVGKCPRCSGDVTEAPKGFFCSNRACKFALWRDNKYFAAKKKTITKEVAKSFLTDGHISMTNLHSEKTGKPYSATIFLDDKGDGYVNFRMEFEKKGAKK